MSLTWYVVIGAFNAIFYVFLGKTFVALGLGPSVAGVAAFLPCAAISYFGHKHKTFRSVDKHLREAPRYILLIGLGLALGAVLPRAAKLSGVPLEWGFAAVSIAVPIANLIAMRFWVFASTHK